MSPDEEVQETGGTTEAAPAEATTTEPAAAASPPAEAPAAAAESAPSSEAPAGEAAASGEAPRRSESRSERESDDDDRRGGGRRFFGRRKVCTFCVDKSTSIDYKDPAKLRRYVSDRGRIEGRRRTGTCAKHQRWLAVALKRARHLALLPYAPEHIRLTGTFAPRR